MIIHLPFPNPALNPNRSKGTHWTATSKMRQQSKQDAFYLTRQAIQTQKLEASDTYALEIIFNAPDKRKRDRDNLLASSKSALDGIAQALGIDDSQFEPIILRSGYAPKLPEMIVKIEKDPP